MAGTKHTITTDTNKIIHQKLNNTHYQIHFRSSYRDGEKTGGDETESSPRNQHHK